MKQESSVLSGIKTPEDLRRLGIADLIVLAEEIRHELVEVVSRNGGHLASNLGVVELSIALHRVFASPEDSIVWDVGHQSYVHKLLTGRQDLFCGLRQREGLSGFPRRAESNHDCFETGHSSTSISAALGILEAKRRQGLAGKAIAVIGDGALSGGMAQEALSHAGQLGRDLIVVLNDNKMSISPNVGAFSRYLSRLTATGGYERLRTRMDRLLLATPLVGPHLHASLTRLKRLAKAAFLKGNIFCELGFEYVGPIDGHDVVSLMAVLGEARCLSRPVVVHVITRKGKGHKLAEDNPTAYHGLSPTAVRDGKLERRADTSFTEAFQGACLREAAADDRVVAVSAAMAKGTGLGAFQRAYPARFYDVGIAEQHAVTFAAGMASAGLRPIVAIYSTFLQRAYDQVLHDVALQNLPVCFCLDRAGAVGDDGPTHQGWYDIAYLRSMPNMQILAPASGTELRLMLAYALKAGGPVAIRYPKASLPPEDEAYLSPIEKGRGIMLREGGDSGLLVMVTGGLAPRALAALECLARSGLRADLYTMRFLKPLDEDYLCSLLSGYRYCLFLEEGVAMGGLGEQLASLALGLAGRAGAILRFRAMGLPDRVVAHMTRDELLDSLGFHPDAIAHQARLLLSGQEGEARSGLSRQARAGVKDGR